MMTAIYEKATETYGDVSYEAIYRVDGDVRWSIPIDEANSDYQEYLKSLDEAASL